MTNARTAEQQPWEWPEETWRAIVGKVRAGRSLKPLSWHGGARVAVALSFDSDHELLSLRDNDRSPGRLSQGEYGARQGVPRILRVLARHGVPATFFVPAVTALLYPEEQRRIVAEGHEIALHGWIHERNAALEPEVERALMTRATDVLTEVAGVRPTGMRTPSWDFSPSTLTIARELGLLYDSSLMADDDPYELLEDGEPTGVVELPPEWIRDDYPYFGMDRFGGIRPHTPPSSVLEIFKAEFDGAYEEGGLLVLTMHPHIMGHRSRIRALDALIGYMKGHTGVWFARHDEIARYCLEQADGVTRTA